MTDLSVTVTRVGWHANFTDLGRHDAEISGVPSGGAADQHSAAVANILVGNPRDAVIIEAIGNFGFTAPVALLVAVTGAPASVTVDGTPVDQWNTLVVHAGQELVVTANIGGPGLRRYIAIAGALEAPRFLGSAAPDPRMGFTQELRQGQALPLSHPPTIIASMCGTTRTPFIFDVPRLEFPDGPWVLHVVRAAEVDIVPEIETLLSESTYTVKPQSDHVGVRLAGAVRHPQGPEIVSHGVPIGAVEIPHADDELILLGRYRTLTAGYPVVGVVAKTDLALVGQLSAKNPVRFRWIERVQAVERAIQHEAALVALEQSVSHAFEGVVERLNVCWWQ